MFSIIIEMVLNMDMLVMYMKKKSTKLKLMFDSLYVRRTQHGPFY